MHFVEATTHSNSRGNEEKRRGESGLGMKYVPERAACLHLLWHIFIGSCDRSVECHNSDIYAFHQVIWDTYGALLFETLPKGFRNLGPVFFFLREDTAH